MPDLLPFFMQEMLANVSKEDNEIKSSLVGKEEIKLAFFTGGMFSHLYRKSAKHE